MKFQIHYLSKLKFYEKKYILSIEIEIFKLQYLI